MRNEKKAGRSRGLGGLFNPRQWLDIERLQLFFSYIVQGFHDLLVPQQKKITESFTDALVRLGLKEEDLLIQQRALFRLSVLMCSIAFVFYIYFIYQLMYGSFVGSFLTCSVMLLAVAFAFRYHFWYFQIRQRKLGCTLRMWFKQGLLGEKE